ncbi:hypothetical protein [Algoriphagus antarcticus]|uniref:Uncharacterized protein n=1 Tax=Algoriphagus antarcticus TaxID=238540 RepID=A0A3E0D6U2_9BACT|nr:hypothetical protein [Algoriphagus antarcticus]REG78376.1 hypothetical protein C8N25_13518 [Algoriphagus antarcticus]
MGNDKESDFEKKIDKDNIRVTPFGTNKKKKNVPDEKPQEEFIEPKPNSSENEKG